MEKPDDRVAPADRKITVTLSARDWQYIAGLLGISGPINADAVCGPQVLSNLESQLGGAA
jgi:hypothetical protein